MATPSNAPYKILQRTARSLCKARQVFISSYGFGKAQTAIALRDGKLNKKSQRRLATGYKPYLATGAK